MMIEKYNFLIEFNLWFVLNCVVIFSGQFWKLVPEEAGTFTLDAVLDFLIKLGTKPQMHLWKDPFDF